MSAEHWQAVVRSVVEGERWLVGADAAVVATRVASDLSDRGARAV